MGDDYSRAFRYCFVLLGMAIVAILVLAGLVIITLHQDGTVLATASSALTALATCPFVYLYGHGKGKKAKKP